MLDYHVYAYRRHKLLKGLVYLRRKKMARVIKPIQRDLLAIRRDIGSTNFSWRNYNVPRPSVQSLYVP